MTAAALVLATLATFQDARAPVAGAEVMSISACPDARATE